MNEKYLDIAHKAIAYAEDLLETRTSIVGIAYVLGVHDTIQNCFGDILDNESKKELNRMVSIMFERMEKMDNEKR